MFDKLKTTSPLEVLAYIRDNPGDVDSRFRNFLLVQNYIEESDDGSVFVTPEGEEILEEFLED